MRLNSMLATVLIFLCSLVISSCSNDELAPISLKNRETANIAKLAHIRMDFAGIMQTIGIKGRYVGFTYIRPLYGFAPFWRS